MAKKKILVVEDYLPVRNSLKVFLEEEGFFVATAADGNEGLSVFAQQKPDLVVTDLNMPVMNGLEMTKGLRGAGSKVPVIVMTAHPSPAVRQTLVEAGADFCFDKVDLPDVLRAKIAELLAAPMPRPRPTEVGDGASFC